MYYHVIVETNEKVGKSKISNRKYVEFDKTELSEIISEVIIPYENNEKIHFDGYFLFKKDITRIAVRETEETASNLSKYENDNMEPGLIYYVSKEEVIEYEQHSKDVTKEVFQIAKKNKLPSKSTVDADLLSDYSKVFVVHGRDDLAKTEVARFLEKLNLEPIILHEQVSLGMTIIEKIEHYSNVRYGIVIYTPCDIGTKNGEDKLKPRARQNVVFEHGYLIGKLQRKNVCALVKENVETPNDISGVVYISMDSNKAWTMLLAKELKSVGYDIDMNNL